MGRHSRRGPAPKKGPDNSSSNDGGGPGQTGPGAGAEVPGGRAQNLSQASSPQVSALSQAARWGGPQGRGPGDGTSAPGGAGHRVPAQGGPRLPEGTPAHGFPRLPEGTPARGLPRLPDGTPAHGFPRIADGTPAQGTPRARGGHPEQRESGGGWGELDGRGPGGQAAAGPGGAVPRQRQEQRQQSAGTRQGPRQDYLDAFTDDTDLFAPGAPKGRAGKGQREGHGSRRGAGTSVAAHPSDPYGSSGSVTDWPDDIRGGVGTGAGSGSDGTPPLDAPPSAKGGKGRTFTGIAAAAIVTVLAVVVAGQVTGERDTAAGSSTATDQARDARDSVTAGQPTPSGSPSVAKLTYEQAMGTKYPLSAKLDGSGKFDAVPGVDKAPGKGQKYTYRVDVEQGLGLDGALFAEAVQKTLNDDRSWAHRGARTFERVYTGKPDFVITLASPGTTADWCAKSGLDTTEDNVSCDSAATERVMINAYRWAQGSTTYGDRIHAYRQMLINHEVGHRLGYSHVTCDKNGELAPVMQQQTKFLDHDGIHCRPNPWPYPGS
ncbi:DUF3152 domain-containing protein [Streptomyces sp. NRRL B-3229]|uniref:DUF3152 domain-containing protein n=1 Tax=Streptomyces sp. NRRL B-3229 TaxID=1463836 RepID=UPI0004C245FE|nr:DUF3152 domain-containing protein [Streptomyces sp. NRRL B-3229]